MGWFEEKSPEVIWTLADFKMTAPRPFKSRLLNHCPDVI
jgi:hypothetical protein